MQTKIIAFAGKGGVGKTSLSAAAVKLLSETYPGKRILAVDADPAVGLTYALHAKPASTVDDIRRTVIQDVRNGNAENAAVLLAETKDLIYDALEEKEKFALIAVGRPEAAGCYCAVNSYLKTVISLLAEQFDYVVIDGEAGIEQINRRVMEKVTHLILVTDASRKGCEVVKTIVAVSEELMMAEKTGVIANRLPDGFDAEVLDLGSLPLLAGIGTDSKLQEWDIRGDDVMELPSDTAMLRGLREALEKLGVL